MFTTELIENIDFTKTCRLCLNQSNEIVSIFEISCYQIPFSIVITECTSLKVSDNDKLPKNVCLECVECLKKFHQFRKLVVNSEHHLNQFLTKFKNNVNKYEKTDSTNNIKEEIHSNEEPIFSDVKSENPLDLEEESEERIKIDENEIPTLSDKSLETEHSEIASKIEIIDEKMEIGENETDLKSHEETRQKTYQRNRTSSFLARHKKPNKSEKSYICKFCNKTFTLESILEIHERTHLVEEPFNRLHCREPSNESPNLIKKCQSSNKGQKPYRCKHCNIGFSAKFNFEIHERTHSGEKPYICKGCNEAFNLKSQLQQHELVHTGEKSFNCDQCGKSFHELCNLKTHKRIHTGEKPYNCKECGKSFTQLSNLKTHERLHSGEKPFNCKHCGKSFIQLYNLKRHEIIHKEEKPFNCKHCRKSYTQLGSLKRHEKTHEDDKSKSDSSD